MRNKNGSFFEVDGFNFPFKEIYFPQKLANGIDDVREVKVAGSDLVQHGGKEKEVLTIHERDLDIRILVQLPLEFEGRVEAAETSTQNENAMLCAHEILRCVQAM